MANTRGTYLFWGDLSTDQAVALCSFAAQGLWMRMLCLCGLSERPGYLEVAGVPLSAPDLAQLTGKPIEQVEPLLLELETRKVFSRDRRGCIYNRRMARDVAQHAREHPKHQENGRKGGNPNLQRGKVPKEDRARPYKRTDSPAKTLRIFEKTGGRCHWCNVVLLWSGEGGEPELFHVDHLVPIRDGGDNSDTNLVPSCATCNHDRAKIGETVTASKHSTKNTDTNPVTKPRARDLNPSPPKKTPSTASETQTQIQKPSPAAAVAAAALPTDWSDRIQAIWNSPSLTGFGRIESWTRQGADFEHDILQVLTGITARNRSTRPEWEPRSLNYFDQAVADAMAMRTAPLPAAKPNGHANGHANGQPAGKSPFHDRWGNFDALAYYRWREAQKAVEEKP